MTFRRQLMAAILTGAVALATPVWAADAFFFTTGTANGRLGSLSQPVTSSKLETETADDFILTDTTTIREATIVGLIPTGASLSSINNVEIEVYRVFPNDSLDPAPHKVPTRMNSPADFEVDTATRDGRLGTLTFAARVLSPSFTASNTVVTGISTATNGEGEATGEQVQITMTFDPPIILPSDHYFFRPEVDVIGGDFLYLSAPRPIVAPGTPFLPDLQSWIRNSDLKPDWLRIGTDIVQDPSTPTFNMTFSLTGDTIPEAGTPGRANCHGKSISALARQFGGINTAASALGFSSVEALQDSLRVFCGK
jgi:hypothetical protein